MIGDTRDGDLPTVEALVTDLGPQFRYLPHNGGRLSHGHDQLNHAIPIARGDYLVFNDDDDVFLEGAFGAIRRAAAALPAPRPLMFRFVPWFRELIWDVPRIVEHRIGGHNFVPPNLPGRLGRWGPHYQGDYSFIRETVDLWPNKDADVVWCTDVIALARPDQ